MVPNYKSCSSFIVLAHGIKVYLSHSTGRTHPGDQQWSCNSSQSCWHPTAASNSVRFPSMHHEIPLHDVEQKQICHWSCLCSLEPLPLRAFHIVQPAYAIIVFLKSANRELAHRSSWSCNELKKGSRGLSFLNSFHERRQRTKQPLISSLYSPTQVTIWIQMLQTSSFRNLFAW